jgi:hypothetical protein
VSRRHEPIPWGPARAGTVGGLLILDGRIEPGRGDHGGQMGAALALHDDTSVSKSRGHS